MTEFTIREVPLTDELTRKIDDGFRQHTLETIGEDGDFKRLSLTAHAGLDFAGVITFCVVLGSLQIRQLFVEPQYRRRGLGKMLLTKALSYGEQQGCLVAFVETMSFQALPFYEKLGFSLEFSRYGFTRNAALHFLRKKLKNRKRTFLRKTACHDGEESEIPCCEALV